MHSAIAAIVGRFTSAIKPTWPIFIPRRGMLRESVTSAARKMVPSPPRTMAASIPGNASCETFAMPGIATSEIVKSEKPAVIRSGASSCAAEIASSREGLMIRATDLSAITPVPSLSLDRVIAHL